MENFINLSDITLNELENIHIDAKGTIEGKLENIGIDFSHLSNATITFTSWDTKDSVTGKVKHRKKRSNN